jgi:hypothetical protein
MPSSLTRCEAQSVLSNRPTSLNRKSTTQLDATRPERRDELCEKLTPAIIDALAPLGAKMPEGEPVGIRVEWKINHARLERRQARRKRGYSVMT